MPTNDEMIDAQLSKLSEADEFATRMLLQMKEISNTLGGIDTKQNEFGLAMGAIVAEIEVVRVEVADMKGTVNRLDRAYEDRRFFRKHWTKIVSGMVAIGAAIAGALKMGAK